MSAPGTRDTLEGLCGGGLGGRREGGRAALRGVTGKHPDGKSCRSLSCWLPLGKVALFLPTMPGKG